MPTFHYLATNLAGEDQEGKLEANSREEAAEAIKRQGLLVLELSQEGGGVPFSLDLGRIFGLFRGEMSGMERVIFTSSLASMLKTGLPIIEAIEAFIDESSSPRVRSMLQHIIGDIEAGRPLSQALSDFPKTFPPIYTHVVASGEAMGNLNATLEYLAAQLKKDYELRSRIRGAMLYPAVILAAMGAVVIFLTFTVIPKITAFTQTLGQELPLSTKILVGVSNFAISYAPLLAIGAIGAMVLLFAALRTQVGKSTLDALIIKFPLIGEMVRKYNLARFSRLLGSFFQYGIPLTEAFEIIADSLSHTQYRQASLRFRDKITRGQALSDAIKDEKKEVFPGVISRVVKGAEKSGGMYEALSKMAEFYEADLDDSLKNITTIIEPILIIILGIVVAGVAISVVSPIYQLTGALR